MTASSNIDSFDPENVRDMKYETIYAAPLWDTVYSQINIGYVLYLLCYKLLLSALYCIRISITIYNYLSCSYYTSFTILH